MSSMIVTVGEFKKALNGFIKQGEITNKTKIYMSTDEEGNEFHPFVTHDGAYNIDIDKEADTITLYP
jgi:hypothetical protein